MEKTYGGNIGIVQYLTIEIPEGGTFRTQSNIYDGGSLAKIFNFCLTKASVISNNTMGDDERFNNDDYTLQSVLQPSPN